MFPYLNGKVLRFDQQKLNRSSNCKICSEIFLSGSSRSKTLVMLLPQLSCWQRKNFKFSGMRLWVAIAPAT